MSSAVIGSVSLAAAILAVGLLPFSRRWRIAVPPHPDRPALRDAGWRGSLTRWEAVRAAATLSGLVLGSLAGAALPAAAICGAMPSLIVRARSAAAHGRARSALGPLLVATHAALRSGLALPEALRRAVAGCEDAIARRPFEEALTRFDLGDPLDVALAFGASQARDPRVADAMHTLALGVSQRLPVDRAAALLLAVTEHVRHEEGLENEVHARTAGIRLQLYILSAVVPTLAVYLVATMPGLAATLGSPLGRTVLLPAAAGLEIAGVVVSRRIIRSVSGRAT